MFTGIIEALGKVMKVTTEGTNKTFWLESPLSHELKVDESIAHDGVCLTVEETVENTHRVTAVQETLMKTNLNTWKNGSLVNLERSLLLSSRLDGHFVQGHVDTPGTCKKIKDRNGSKDFTFSYHKKFRELVIEKGSVCINGISLTAYGVKKSSFRVAVIPYTLQHTNLQHLKTGDAINIEFDMIGKYIIRKIID
ncbi:MAG: riboflavin synthase [Chitinophagaceae bacterium]